MKATVVALLLACLPAFGQAADTRTPEFIADQKADRLYQYFLDGMMPSPAFNPHNLTFRISNDIFSGGQGEEPEFYLMAVLHRDWLEIRYREKESIHRALYRYFLENPDVTIDQLRYWPEFVHKRIEYTVCPQLEEPVNAVEQYIRTALISPAPYRFTGLNYLVGYHVDHHDVTFEVNSPEARPVAELLKIRDMALKCAKDLPTVGEAEKARLLELKRQDEEIRKNFKGVIHDSPPPITLTHGTQKYSSAIGTSCWGIGHDILCDDVFAYVTPAEQVVVRRGDRVQFDIPERDRLEHLEFAITRVTSRDLRQREEDKEFAAIKIWEAKTRDREMTPAQLESLLIDKPPGDYIVTLYGQWADYGDAAHGFYLKVTR